MRRTGGGCAALVKEDRQSLNIPPTPIFQVSGRRVNWGQTCPAAIPPPRRPLVPGDGWSGVPPHCWKRSSQTGSTGVGLARRRLCGPIGQHRGRLSVFSGRLGEGQSVATVATVSETRRDRGDRCRAFLPAHHPLPPQLTAQPPRPGLLHAAGKQRRTGRQSLLPSSC